MKKRLTPFDLLKADFQYCSFTFIILHRGGIHSPAQVNYLEPDTFLSQVFLNLRKNKILKVITLCLHIGKGAADKDGEGSPGSVGNHL
jgi:hypothetical protein